MKIGTIFISLGQLYNAFDGDIYLSCKLYVLWDLIETEFHFVRRIHCILYRRYFYCKIISSKLCSKEHCLDYGYHFWILKNYFEINDNVMWFFASIMRYEANEISWGYIHLLCL